MEKFPGEVGTRITVEIPGRPRAMAKFEAQLLGYKLGEFLLIPVPARAGEMMLKANDRCMLRWLYEGKAYGCSSYVIKLDTQPCNLAFLECPLTIPARTLRRYARFSLVLPVVVFHGGGAPSPNRVPDFSGVLRDLSEGGCLVRLKGQLELGWKLTLQFRTPLEELVSVAGQVVRLRQAGEAGWTGLIFSEFYRDSREALNRFLDFCCENLEDMEDS